MERAGREIWAGLEDVPWAGLEHAYGPAGDVPDCLRQLRDPQQKVRERAQWALYGNIYHQGSRYPASAAAIPFLLRLAADAGQPDRAWVLTYVAHLICGGMTLAEDPWLCDGLRICRGAGGAGPWVEPWPGEGPEAREQREEIADWLACYRAAEAGLPAYLEAARGGPTEIRAAALYLLACFYPLRGELVPALRGMLAAGVEAPGVRLGLMFALGRLGAGAEPEIRARLTDPDLPTRLVAAAAQFCTGPLGGAGRLPAEVGEEVVRALTAVLEAGEVEIPGDLPFLRDPAQEAAGLLLRLPLEQLQSARAALRAALARSRMFGSVPIARALLRADFPEGDFPEGDFPEGAGPLTAAQRQTLRALVEHGDLWTIGNLSGDFAAHGLPFSREAAADMVADADPRWQEAWRRGQVHRRALEQLREAELMLDTFHDPDRALEALSGLLGEREPPPGAWSLLGRALAAGAELGTERRGALLSGLGEARAAWEAAEAEEGAAAAALLHALALHPADGAAWAALGMLRVEQDHPEAAEAFGRAADLGFQRSTARQNQAILMFDRGQEAAALRVLEREAATHPEDGNIWYHLGLMRCKAGEWARSAEAISRALVLDPGRANAWYTRACAAARLGWRTEALSDVAEALRLDPALAGEIALDEDFAGLRADPGFLMLIQQGQGAVA